MANQAIALGIRAPQGVNLGSAIQQNSALINMMVQQKAVDRQNALAAQKLEQDAALAGPAVKKATSEAQSARLKVIKDFMDTSAFGIGNSRNADDARRVGEILKSEFDDQTFHQAVDQTLASIPKDPAAFPEWRIDALIRTMEASNQLEYLVPKVSTEAIIGEGGDVGVLTRGGMNAPTIKTPRTLVPAPQTQNAPVTSAEAERFIASYPEEARPAIRERVMRGDLGNIPMGNPAPAARGRGGMGGPDEGMPEMPMRASSTQSGMVSNLGPDDGYVEAAQPFRAKNPMQAPAPGVNIQPLPRIAGQAAAEESGRQGVRVTTDPLIKGKEERVVRVEKLRGELPKAHAQTSTLVNSLTDRINAIDEFLRNPYRNTIVGSIEGRIPKLFQNERRSDAQAQWDFITNNSVLDKLIQDRQSTETGASPQGLVSDRDLGVAASAANRLTQTGSEAAQEAEMKRLRSILYRTRESALRGYTNTYREVLGEDPRFNLKSPSVSPAYTGPRDAKRTKSGAIVKNW